jgi:hypothetical protein
MMALDLYEIEQLTRGQFGTFDMPCPVCSPLRSRKNQRKEVLRIWREAEGFATYHCVHCGMYGHTRDPHAQQLDPLVLERIRAEQRERERASIGDRLVKALRLWERGRPIKGSLAEKYLRRVRNYRGSLPGTLRFLPARGQYPASMIAPFGFPGEPEPGVLEIENSAVRGVHLTRLRSDGLGKMGDPAKIMIGSSMGYPIVLAAPNDLLGLAIAEGIEDGLSLHEATGLGAWAAGSASRLPALAEAIPSFIEAVNILVDDDAAGQLYSAELVDRIEDLGIEAHLIYPRSA